MDVAKTPCLSILARTQCREWERGQGGADQSSCLSILARKQDGVWEWGENEGGDLLENVMSETQKTNS